MEKSTENSHLKDLPALLTIRNRSFVKTLGFLTYRSIILLWYSYLLPLEAGYTVHRCKTFPGQNPRCWFPRPRDSSVSVPGGQSISLDQVRQMNLLSGTLTISHKASLRAFLESSTGSLQLLQLPDVVSF